MNLLNDFRWNDVQKIEWFLFTPHLNVNQT